MIKPIMPIQPINKYKHNKEQEKQKDKERQTETPSFELFLQKEN